jgi:2-keto-3-deoxy-L-rhamnonate aldolase RhmA
MITNQVRRRLAAGEPTIGAFLGLGSPGVAGLMANAGFDWLVIETEHNALDSAEIEHMLMAMAGTDVTPIVRVPSSNRVYIQRALDMGALGVLVPLVRKQE